MRTLLLLLLLFLAVVPGWSQGWRPGEMEVRIYLKKPTDAGILRNLNLNTEAAMPDGSVICAYVVPADLDTLKHSGLTFEISIADLNQHYLHYWDNPLVPPGYYSYEQIIAVADSLAASFPLICKKVILGTSVGGRQLAALKISDNVDVDEPEPSIMFDGGIHGDEVGGAQNVIMYARELCKGYGINPTYTSLINSREIWLYPMVNPDGRASMSRYNNNFVDINRDCGYMWNAEGNSPAAFSQIETKTLRNFILDNQFVVYTNYHSGTEILSYPWSYRGDMTRDHNQINNMASVYAAYSGYTNLLYGQGYNIMYAINGSTKDLVYGTLGNVGWSMEISNDKQPPASMISMYYNFNTPSMTEMITRCGWGVEGLVTDSLTGEPVRATVWVGNYYPVYNDPLVGDYHKFVLPGTYTIRVEANGYKTKSISGIVVPAQGSAATNVQLTADQTWSGFKVISCQIPGNNFGDEGYTPGALGRVDSVAYALGKGGWIVIDMGDTIFDGPGADFKVIQHGSPGKPFQVSGSNNTEGPFITIGNGTGTTTFDFAPTLIHKARYLKIKDTGTGPSWGAGIGFNLDAIEMLTPPLIVNFAANNTSICNGTGTDFTDQSIGNPSSWSWSFPGGSPVSSNAQNPQNITYRQPGEYNVSLTISNGVSSSVKIKSNYIQVIPAPVVNLGNDTAICDHDQITLNAGNPGSTYLWSTGATTQTIVADSTGTGYGSASYSVLVTSPSSCTGTDSISVMFENCTGIDNRFNSRQINIFPNPSPDGRFSFQVTGYKDYLYQIVSATGVEIQAGIVTQNANLILSEQILRPGLFLFRLFNTNNSETRKLLVL